MPYKELTALDIRKEMVNEYFNDDYTATELSDRYGLARKTIYKWIKRYRSQGEEGLAERSHAPFSHPNATDEEIVQTILEMKMKRMKWGPKKILTRLKLDQPETRWPADSTGSEILKRYGLVGTKKYRRRTPPYTAPFLGCDMPNMTWSADYKGQFRMGNGRLCYPLTISDNYSRFLLDCQGLAHPKLEQTKPHFEWTFRNYGLPQAIRTDNGFPFASTGLGGLSRLSVWFIQLGIKPERILSGCPEQNGRHERMHKTLKEAVASPPKKNMAEQQKAFNYFKDEYNYERPHEALDQNPPASVYQPSSRPFPAKIPAVDYDSNTTIRFVHTNGEIKWKGDKIYLSEALIGQYVALTPVDNHL
jgi:transposase InsO family protein